VEFCPKCGSLLILKKVQGKEKLQLVCPKGDYKKPEPVGKMELPLEKVIEHTPHQMVAVVDKQQANMNTLPTINVECPKCGNNKAYVWMLQTRGADESSTQFMRCTKCSYTFRETS
jgi:DNA-directed RNA polymerase subunit M